MRPALPAPAQRQQPARCPPGGGQPRAVKELSWRAQHRLSRPSYRLAARRLHHNKATVAVAHELCAFIWELARLLGGHPNPKANPAPAPAAPPWPPLRTRVSRG
jgi:hypothetical protein